MRLRWLIGIAVAVALGLPVGSASASDPQAFANSLLSDSVQSVGVPSSSYSALSRAQLAALKAEIEKLDSGRIWIFVISPRSESALGDFADPVFGDMPAGTLIGVAEDAADPNTTNYWVGSSWEDSNTAQSQLNTVINGYHKGQGSLFDDLKLEIQSFARGDAAAGRPRLSSGGGSGGGGSGSGAGTGSGGAQPASGSGGGSSVGVILLAIFGAIVLLVGAGLGFQYMQGERRASHRRALESADAHDQARADFTKLGEAIGALDIDSSMPGASELGKQEYAQAIDCYQDAEKRLQQAGEQYQFERAVAAIKNGLQHVGAADRFFNPPAPVGRASAPAAAAPAAGSRPADAGVSSRLEKLSALHERGVLSDAEFAQEKAKLLGI
jgi:hypothetical protein